MPNHHSTRSDFSLPETVKNKSDEIKAWEKKGVEINVGDVNSEDDVRKAFQGIQPPQTKPLLSMIL